MGIRGRKSAAQLAVVGPLAGIERIQRPAPPRHLTIDQKAEWVAVANSLPAEWFQRYNVALLEAYVVHSITLRDVAMRVAAFVEKMEALPTPPVLEAYDRLLKMQEREGRALSSLATRMRISQHSAYDKTKKKPISASATPWDVEQEVGPDH